MSDTASSGTPSPWGAPVGTARLRTAPDDFRVRELPLVSPTGHGEHLLVHIRKRGLTTPAAAAALARAFRVAGSRVSYAGMKDRHAVTEQWFSVHRPGSDRPVPEDLPEGLAVLAVARHGRKLRRGALAGNAFELRLRAVDASPRAVGRRLAAIAHRGVPNYFGAQRFGRAGDNVAEARALLRGQRRVRDRGRRGILLSAARSELFNQVLAARVRDDTWDRAVAGDRLMLDGRRSLFDAASEPAATLAARLARGQVHPTGPLPGRPGKLPGEAPLPAVEDACLAEDAELVAGLQRAGVDADRRPLRVRPGRLGWHFPAPGVLVVSMHLPPGAYATTVLGQVFRLEDGGQPDEPGRT